jgi:hypothetical protein
MTSSGPGPRSRVLFLGESDELADDLRDAFCKTYDVVQAADCQEALRLIAEGGADVLLLTPAISLRGRAGRCVSGSPAPWMDLGPEAVRAVGELLTALAKRRALNSRGIPPGDAIDGN